MWQSTYGTERESGTYNNEVTYRLNGPLLKMKTILLFETMENETVLVRDKTYLKFDLWMIIDFNSPIL